MQKLFWDLQLWHVDSEWQHVGYSSLTRAQTQAPDIGSVEPDHQGGPLCVF